MFEEQKELKTKKTIFNFFKKEKKKENVPLKVGKYTLKTLAFLFRIFSYILGSLFLIGLGYGFIHGMDRQERMKRYENHRQLMAIQANDNIKTISQFNLDLLNILKQQQNPTLESTVALINNTFKTNIKYKFVNDNIIMFNRTLNSQNFEYVLNINTKNLTLLNSNKQLEEQFKNLIGNNSQNIVFHTINNNSVDKSVYKDSLSISFNK